MGRILVVDDDDDLREIIAETIANAGYVVEQAENGLVALDRMRAQPHPPPCVVVLDLMMPVMNGWQLVAAMHADASLSGVPICILTAQDRMAPPPNACLLKKPLRTSDLLAKIAEYCKPSP
jgi:CheY-like chemotaxis protein